MKVLLSSQGIWDIVEDVYVEPIDAVAEAALLDAQKTRLRESGNEIRKLYF